MLVLLRHLCPLCRMDHYARQFQLSSYTQTCFDESKHQCWQCCTACTDEAACPILRSIRICVRSPSLECSHGGLSKANELSFSSRLCDVRAHLCETHSHQPLRIDWEPDLRLRTLDGDSIQLGVVVKLAFLAPLPATFRSTRVSVISSFNASQPLLEIRNLQSQI